MTRSIISALHCFARTQQDTELDALCAEAKRGDEDAIAAISDLLASDETLACVVANA